MTRINNFGVLHFVVEVFTLFSRRWEIQDPANVNTCFVTINVFALGRTD